MKGREYCQTWLPVLLTAPLVTVTIFLYVFWRHIGWGWDGNIRQLQHHREQCQLDPVAHAFREPKTLTFEWLVTKEERRPDGVAKEVLLVNDQFPGPTIEARSGDRLVIKVENAVDEGIAIHWHGLHMRDANAMDGAAGITQDPIAFGEIFIYDFVVDQPGTFWYHAHSGVQRADGLYGGLIVHELEKDIQPEYLLMIGDWYHRQADAVLASYMTADSFGMEPVPDSILVNGHGAYDCSSAVPARPVDCEAHELAALRVHSASRLRVINVGSYAGISMSMKSAAMSVITVDGGNPVSSNLSDSIGVLEPGERIDVHARFTTDTALEISLDSTQFKYSNLALTEQQSFPVVIVGQVAHIQLDDNNSTPIDLRSLQAEPEDGINASSTLTMVLYTITEKLAHLDYVPTGNINRTIWQPQSPALLSSTRDEWDDHQFVPEIPYRANDPIWVTLVVNNLDEEAHAFHLHGHDFYVLSTYSSTYNWGSFDPFEDIEPPGGPYSNRPLKKDTVAIPRRGYAVLRFRADNPGIWAFHCHVLLHMATGMAMAFEIG